MTTLLRAAVTLTTLVSMTPILCGHEVLYGSDARTDTLKLIDVGSGDCHTVGPWGASGVAGGMAYDPHSDRLFLSNVGSLGRVTTVDRRSGTTTDLPVRSATMGIGGLAFDRNTSTLYGVTPNDLITIDTATGAGTVVGPLGISGAGAGLAYDHVSDTLYMVEQLTASLHVIDTATGSATLIGPCNRTIASAGLAFSEVHGLILTNDQFQTLCRVDTSTGNTTAIATIERVQGLAFVNGPQLIGVAPRVDRLYDIDMTTGSSTLLGQAMQNMQKGGTAYDPASDTLFVTSFTRFGTADRRTGQVTFLNDMAYSTGIFGLAFDRNQGVLYGATDSELVTIDTGSGQATAIGPLGIAAGSNGLAHDFVNDVLYLVSQAESLYTVDKATGAATLVGAISTGTLDLRNCGLAYYPTLGLILGGQAQGTLHRLNTQTGRETTIASSLPGLGGLAFVDGDRCFHASSRNYGMGTVHPRWGALTLSEAAPMKVGLTGTVSVDYDNAGGDPGVLAVGLSPWSVPFLDGTLLVDGLLFAVPIPGTTFLHHTVDFPVPNDPLFACGNQEVSITFQALMLDTDTVNPTPHGLVFSDGLEVTIGY